MKIQLLIAAVLVIMAPSDVESKLFGGRSKRSSSPSSKLGSASNPAAKKPSLDLSSGDLSKPLLGSESSSPLFAGSSKPLIGLSGPKTTVLTPKRLKKPVVLKKALSSSKKPSVVPPPLPKAAPILIPNEPSTPNVVSTTESPSVLNDGSAKTNPAPAQNPASSIGSEGDSLPLLPETALSSQAPSISNSQAAKLKTASLAEKLKSARLMQAAASTGPPASINSVLEEPKSSSLDVGSTSTAPASNSNSLMANIKAANLAMKLKAASLAKGSTIPAAPEVSSSTLAEQLNAASLSDEAATKNEPTIPQADSSSNDVAASSKLSSKWKNTLSALKALQAPPPPQTQPASSGFSSIATEIIKAAPSIINAIKGNSKTDVIGRMGVLGSLMGGLGINHMLSGQHDLDAVNAAAQAPSNPNQTPNEYQISNEEQVPDQATSNPNQTPNEYQISNEDQVPPYAPARARTMAAQPERDSPYNIEESPQYDDFEYPPSENW